MTAMVVFGSFQQQVGVGIAAGADDVVHTGAVFIPPVPIQCITGYSCHRAQARQRTPETIARAYMRRVQSPRFATEEAFGEIVRIPQIEISHLRTFNADDAKE